MRYQDLLSYLWKGILGGISIGIAALCFLKGGKLIGAALFAFGLSAIIMGQWKLFTGACGFADYRKTISWVNIILMLIANAVGVILACVFGANQDMIDAAQEVGALRASTPLIRLLGGGILCGFIMTVSVMHARNGKWLPLILGIPTFVICGFPHCIADIAYYWLSGEWGIHWGVTILGNFIGCNIPTLTLKERKPLFLSDYRTDNGSMDLSGALNKGNNIV